MDAIVASNNDSYGAMPKSQDQTFGSQASYSPVAPAGNQVCCPSSCASHLRSAARLGRDLQRRCRHGAPQVASRRVSGLACPSSFCRDPCCPPPCSKLCPCFGGITCAKMKSPKVGEPLCSSTNPRVRVGRPRGHRRRLYHPARHHPAHHLLDDLVDTHEDDSSRPDGNYHGQLAP